MNDDIKDVEFEEVKHEDEKNIRGKVLFYSTSQVATLLEQPDSKIRYYTSVFDDILQIKISNKQRQYTQQDIDKLRFIIELKNEGMTLRQISEYCSEVDFNSENGIQIKESNPLSIQTLAASLLEEQNKQLLILAEKQDNQLQDFKQDLKQEIINFIQSNNEILIDDVAEKVFITVDSNMNTKLSNVIQSQQEIKELHQQNKEDLKDFVAITIQNEVRESLQSQFSDFKTYIDTKEQEFNKKLTEKEDALKINMEERKKLQEQLDQQKSKGFFSKIFGK